MASRFILSSALERSLWSWAVRPFSVLNASSRPFNLLTASFNLPSRPEISFPSLTHSLLLSLKCFVLSWRANSESESLFRRSFNWACSSAPLLAPLLTSAVFTARSPFNFAFSASKLDFALLRASIFSFKPALTSSSEFIASLSLAISASKSLSLPLASWSASLSSFFRSLISLSLLCTSFKTCFNRSVWASNFSCKVSNFTCSDSASLTLDAISSFNFANFASKSAMVLRAAVKSFDRPVRLFSELFRSPTKCSFSFWSTLYWCWTSNSWWSLLVKDFFNSAIAFFNLSTSASFDFRSSACKANSEALRSKSCFNFDASASVALNFSFNSSLVT